MCLVHYIICTASIFLQLGWGRSGGPLLPPMVPHLLHGLAIVLAAVAAAGTQPAAPLAQHTVASLDGATKLTLGTAGAPLALAIHGGAALSLTASGIELDGQLASSNASKATPLPGGGVSFARQAFFGATRQHAATVTETFRPAASGAVEWSVTVKGTSAKRWAPTVRVSLGLAADGSRWAMWAPWSAPGCSATGSGCEGCDGRGSHLAPQPLRCFAKPATYSYGSTTSIPLVSLHDNLTDSSITLSAAPAANLLQLANLATSGGLSAGKQPSMGIDFAAAYRVSSDTPAFTLTFHIAGGQACPRDVLRLYTTRHLEVFDPPNMNVHYRGSGMGSCTFTSNLPLLVMSGSRNGFKTYVF